MKSIYGCRPVNKTAALVANQSGCSDELTDEQLRDNLVARVKALQELVVLEPKNSMARKLMGQEIKDLNDKINAIRPSKGQPFGIQQAFIDVAREQLSKHEFSRWMGMAAERIGE